MLDDQIVSVKVWALTIKNRAIAVVAFFLLLSTDAQAAKKRVSELPRIPSCDIVPVLRLYEALLIGSGTKLPHFVSSNLLTSRLLLMLNPHGVPILETEATQLDFFSEVFGRAPALGHMLLGRSLASDGFITAAVKFPINPIANRSLTFDAEGVLVQTNRFPLLDGNLLFFNTVRKIVDEGDVIFDTQLVNSFVKVMRFLWQRVLEHHEDRRLSRDFLDRWALTSGLGESHFHLLRNLMEKYNPVVLVQEGHLLLTWTVTLETLMFESSSVLVDPQLPIVRSNSNSPEFAEVLEILLQKRVGVTNDNPGEEDRAIVAEVLTAERARANVEPVFVTADEKTLMKPLLRGLSPDFRGENRSFPIYQHYPNGFRVVVRLASGRELTMRVMPISTRPAPRP